MLFSDGLVKLKILTTKNMEFTILAGKDLASAKDGAYDIEDNEEDGSETFIIEFPNVYVIVATPKKD